MYEACLHIHFSNDPIKLVQKTNAALFIQLIIWKPPKEYKSPYVVSKLLALMTKMKTRGKINSVISSS